MANDILSNLYYGQVIPWEDQQEDIEKFRELNHKISQLREVIDKRIDEETQELLDQYLDERSDMDSMLALDRFKVGFRLGVQLMLAVYKEP